MSNGNPLPNDVTVNFYDNYVPSLKDGEFTISLSQTLAVDSTQTQKDGGDGDIPSQPQPPISQKLIVRGPRFTTLAPSDVNRVFPPAGSSGSYDQYLPQIVLNRQSLPWERDLLADPTIPWVALLVFTRDELPGPQPAPPAGSQQNPSRSASVLLKDVIGPPAGTLGPSLILEDDEDPNKTYCNVIDIPVDTFNRLLPSIADLPFLAHTRQVSIQNKAVARGQQPDGWFSAVVANRFAVPPGKDAPPIANIVHLVSLEGFETHLNPNGAPAVSGYTSVRMISLYSWVYTSQADPAENFRTLMLDLISGASGADLRLRLPLPNPPVTPPDPTATQAVQTRLQNGYVPLSYAMLSGDQTFAWYRGPLSPIPVTRFLENTGPGQPQNPAAPLTTGDAMIFDPSSGIFDQSYAVAFQTGRSLALASAPFAQSLMDWQRYAHGVVDLILEYMTSPVYSAKLQQDGLIDANGSLTANGVLDLAQLLDTNIVTQAFQDFFATDFYDALAAKIGKKGGFSSTDNTQVVQEAPPPPIPAAPADLLNLMQQPLIVALLHHLSGLDDLGTLSVALTPGAASLAVSAPGSAEAISNGTEILLYGPDGKTSAWVIVSVDTPANSLSVNIQTYGGNATLPAGSALYVQEPNQGAQQVVDWLAGTALLYNVPFNNLVAHPALLPQESIRFFYLDQNWTDALLDGALSIGVQTGRDALFHQLMRDKLYEAVQDGIAEVRAALLGLTPGSAPKTVQPAGFLLRSQGVAGWPGLEIRAWAGLDSGQKPMKPLRLDLLASDTLFAIYPDIPTKLTFTEPSEGLVFGVEDEGLEMRYIPGVTGFTPADIGTVIEKNGSPVWLPPASISASQRSGANPALNIAGATGLVKLIETAIKSNVPGQADLTLTPASFAVQMVRVPEQLLLTPAQPTQSQEKNA